MSYEHNSELGSFCFLHVMRTTDCISSLVCYFFVGGFEFVNCDKFGDIQQYWTANLSFLCIASLICKVE